MRRVYMYHQVSNITHFSRLFNCWSLRCSWSIAFRRCSHCIVILHLTPGFNILRKGNCKPRWEKFNFLVSGASYIRYFVVVLFAVFCVGHRINRCFSLCCLVVRRQLNNFLHASQVTLAKMVTVDLWQNTTKHSNAQIADIAGLCMTISTPSDF